MCYFSQLEVDNNIINLFKKSKKIIPLGFIKAYFELTEREV